MKWSDLTLKERKQIYDTVRADNPNASYFDIKTEFDRIPAYEGGTSKHLPAAFTPGTPEYAQRQQQISGRAEAVQPEAYLTPAGLVKGLFGIGESLQEGDYKGAALDIAINTVPYGAAKAARRLRRGRYVANSATAFTETNTGKKTKAERQREQWDREFNEYYPRQRNANKYSYEAREALREANDSANVELIASIDRQYGTNYAEAYKKLLDSGADEKLKWELLDNLNGTIRAKNIEQGRMSTNVDDYQVKLDVDQYVPGTANHELGHVADGLAGSSVYRDFETGMDYVTNPYLRYLTDADNAISEYELRKLGLNSAANYRGYLLNPTEAKSHMLTLKRTLKDSGKLPTWDTPITTDMLDTYFSNPTSNSMLKNQYNLYRDKNRYIERLNQLTPMELVSPILPIGVTGYMLNDTQERKSN